MHLSCVSWWEWTKLIYSDNIFIYTRCNTQLTISPLQYPTVPPFTISPLVLHLCNTRRIIRLIRTMKMTVHKTSNLICFDRHSGHQNKVEFLYFPYFLLIKNCRWGIWFNLIYLQKCPSSVFKLECLISWLTLFLHGNTTRYLRRI